jgi:hypothetical protein
MDNSSSTACRTAKSCMKSERMFGNGQGSGTGAPEMPEREVGELFPSSADDRCSWSHPGRAKSLSFFIAFWHLRDFALIIAPIHHAMARGEAWLCRHQRLSSRPLAEYSDCRALRVRRGDRVADCAGLEIQCGRKFTVGSNPTLSAGTLKSSQMPTRRTALAARRVGTSESLDSNRLTEP